MASLKINNGSSKSTKKKETESQTRMSLFDVSYGKMRERILLQRLIVIAGLPQRLADRTDLAAHYEKLNLHLRRRYKWDHITGLLLLYPSCMLHIIESSSEVLVSVLKDLKDMQQQPDSILLEAPKVVFMAHSPSSRLFQQWSYKAMEVVTVQTRMLGDETEEETTDTLVCSVLSALHKLSKHPEISKKTLPGSVLDEAPGLMVPQEVLVQLLVREELQSPQQYLQTYHSPLNIVMDSGKRNRPVDFGFRMTRVWKQLSYHSLVFWPKGQRICLASTKAPWMGLGT
ncbi:testis-expressed protein 47 [Centroberyx affinis]|uniref:testis-expressed protein 47 n=1 Tax=Centroberyx affinis TaxID=166261 RepID=UPI003A5C774F